MAPARFRRAGLLVLAMLAPLLAACAAEQGRDRAAYNNQRVAALGVRPDFQRLYQPRYPSPETPRLTRLGDFDTPRNYKGRSWRHRGLDIVGESGDPVIAVAPGEACVETDEINGLSVVLTPRLTEEDSYESRLVFATAHRARTGGRETRLHAVEIRYAHLRSVAERIRSSCGFVQMGDVLGAIGTTGIASVPHLHFEILARDPAALPADPRFAGAINPFFLMRREPGELIGTVTCYEPGMEPRPNEGDPPNSLTIVWPTLRC